jgi:glycine cleavage system aminomethyltransferase T/glycine/D-amino acid oxidase-like deaminating enzyme
VENQSGAGSTPPASEGAPGARSASERPASTPPASAGAPGARPASERPASALPPTARAVLIGAGIVGNSLTHHLAQHGWTDLVLIDKGPLPNPGGSTGHASNFIYPVDHSREMTALTLDSLRQYDQLGVLTTCGGIEVARTAERMEELRRRMASAKSWGVEPVSLVSPAEVKQLVPYIDESVIVGGFYSPGVGVVDSLRAGTLMRERAQQAGALTVAANTEVLGIDVERGRVTRVRTTRGDVEAEVVVICCGVWSPRLARMAGASIPLTPAVHQMIDIGPVPRFADAKSAIEYPIVRDMDTNMYERQDGSGLEVGSYAHRPILYDPEDIPSVEEAALSPTEFPFTEDDFVREMEHALELMPEIVGDESVGIKYAINGLLSLTPDGLPILGETPEVKGLWSAAAVWVKEGPGVGRAVAEWMVHGESEIDLQASDVARFYEHQKSVEHVKARAAEGFNKTYGIVHPGEQWESNRRVRLSPFYERERALDAVFFEAAGWERPHWYESNRPLLEEFGDSIPERESEWDSRWWSPIVNAEHLAMRERVALFDLTAFCVFDVVGPGALDCVQRVAMRQMDVRLGRVVYTPLLTPGGGFRSDLTIMRLADDHFRVVTGGAHGMADLKWIADHLPEDGTAQVFDLTSSWCTLGLWGPRARDVLAGLTSADVSHEGFPFASCRTIEIDSLRVLASRISYVGDLGWELYVPIEQGAKLWDLVWEAGRPHGIVPAGIGVYGTTGRLEKCYRAFGFELDGEYNVVEAGMAWGKVKEQDFVGKEAHVRHREEEPAAVMCTLTVDDHTSRSGQRRYMLGGEPILTREGAPLTDRTGRRSFVTSAGSGPSVGKHILLAYLPPEHASVGEQLAVEYMCERYPVTVERADSTPLFDPDNERVKAAAPVLT